LKPVLDQFDALNIEGVKVVNYCDNFLLLGESEEKVRHAYETLSRLLLGRSVAALVLRQCGEIRRLQYGIDFIGFRFTRKECYPIVSIPKATITDFRRKFREIKDVTRGGVSIQFLVEKTYGWLQDMDVAPQEFERQLKFLLRDRYLSSHIDEPAIQRLSLFIGKRLPSVSQKRDNVLGTPIERTRGGRSQNTHLSIQRFDIPRNFRARRVEEQQQNLTVEERARTADFAARVVREMQENN